MKNFRVKPPKLGEWILRIITKYEDNISLSGDFDEEFEYIADAKGCLRAWFWYWHHLMKSLPFFLKDFFYWGFTMFINHLKIAWRNIQRHKSYSLINIFSLAIGIACCFMIFLYVQDELSYDRFHKKADLIYRIISEFPDKPINARTQYQLAPTLEYESPEVRQAVRIWRGDNPVVQYEEVVNTEQSCLYADPNIFKLFSFLLIKGNPDTSLINLNSIVITEDLARKYFGSDDPIGKVLKVFNRIELAVTGVLANVPQNSHLTFDFILPISIYYDSWGSGLDDWNNREVYTYVMLNDRYDKSRLEAQFPDLIEKYLGEGESAKQSYELQPLKEIYLHSANITWDIQPQSHISYVYIFSSIAFLILLIACINFMILATARSGKRAKEIGLRKVVGATRNQIIRQFLTESILSGFIAMFTAIVLILLFVPTYNRLTGKILLLFSQRKLIYLALLIGLSFFVGIIAGCYPSFVFSAFRSVSVLKGAFYGSTRGTLLKKTLIVFQFVISVVLVAGSIAVFKQLDYIRNKDLGFRKEGIVVISLPDQSKYKTYRSEVFKNQNIHAISAASHVPPATWGYPKLIPKGGNDEDALRMKLFAVDYDFIEIMGMEIVEGRSFSRDYATDGERAFILNKTAVEALGWDKPIGREANLSWVNKQGSVIGVVKDFHFRSLRDSIQPVVLTIAPPDRFLWKIIIQVGTEGISETVAFLQKKWQQIFPDWPFEFQFLDEQLDAQYRTEHRLGKMTSYMAFLAILIACLGLLGLASFAADLRTKEIGIRKVLGASAIGVFRLLSRDLIGLVMIANLIAWPVVYYIIHRWLQNFTYRINIEFDIFLMSAGFTILIALLSITSTIIKASSSNPASALRHE